MKNLNMLLLTSVLAAPAAPALAQSSGSGPGESNFSYSTLGFQLGKATPDEEIIFLVSVTKILALRRLVAQFSWQIILPSADRPVRSRMRVLELSSARPP